MVINFTNTKQGLFQNENWCLETSE